MLAAIGVADRKTGGSCRRGLLGAVLICCLGAASREDAPATLQDMRIAGRVLTFQDSPVAGTLTLAVPYAAEDPASRAEAERIASLLSGGLPVGNLVLQSAVLQQDRLGSAGRFDAIFATAGLDPGLLKAALSEYRVPCITRHLPQVEQGPCVVAIRSAPNVVITLSRANAASAGVRFATAFRMMVNEL